MPEVFAQIGAAHSRDTGKDEEYWAKQVDQITQTTQVMRTRQEVLDPLPNLQAMFLREQNFTPMGAKHAQCAERPAARITTFVPQINAALRAAFPGHSRL